MDPRKGFQKGGVWGSFHTDPHVRCLEFERLGKNRPPPKKKKTFKNFHPKLGQKTSILTTKKFHSPSSTSISRASLVEENHHHVATWALVQPKPLRSKTEKNSSEKSFWSFLLCIFSLYSCKPRPNTHYMISLPT